MKWVAEFDAGMCGTAGQDMFEADTQDEAEQIAYELAIDWTQSYYDVIDDDSVGTEDYPEDEEYSSWVLASSINWNVREYDPEEDGDWEA